MDNYENAAKDSLAAWICERRDPWKRHIDENYTERWNEYYRLWKGVHINQDRNFQSERSELIAPALAQAVEAAVAEVEEAIFGEMWWFDIENRYLGENPEHNEFLYNIRNVLKDDLERQRFRQVATECFLNAAIFGTGLCKLIVEVDDEKQITEKPQMVGNTPIGFDADVKSRPRVVVKPVAIDPREFIPDQSAKCIEDCLGVIHETMVPSHIVEERMESGVYDKREFGTFTWDVKNELMGEGTPTRLEDYAKVTEWHGKIPRHMLEDKKEESDVEYEIESTDDDYAKDGDYVEAIVTVINDGTVVKKRENPFIMGDRSIIKFDWDKTPNRFWGRGICEKGYNPQKALDAEMRGRIDAMALQIRPMMASDATMLPRGFKLDVKSGRNVSVNGNPRDAFFPLSFGDVSQATFHQSGELERMVQMGTGSMDSATSTASNPRNNTASGMSMIQGGMIKRQKRTVRNICWDFIVPVIEKSLWRYQQFDPETYPPIDMKFKPISTLGIMARELENQQITNLLQTTQPESQGWWLLLRSIYQNSSLPDKDELIKIAEQNYMEAANPQPSPEEQQMQKLAMEQAMVDLQKTKSEIMENEANAQSMLENSKQSQDPENAIDAIINKYKVDKEAQVKVQTALIKSDTDKEIALINKDKDLQIAEKNKSEEKPVEKPKQDKAQPVNVNIEMNESASKKFSVKRNKDGFDGEIKSN